MLTGSVGSKSSCFEVACCRRRRIAGESGGRKLVRGVVRFRAVAVYEVDWIVAGVHVAVPLLRIQWIRQRVPLREPADRGIVVAHPHLVETCAVLVGTDVTPGVVR